jgi:putative ABC transport system substrate-binding protein
MAAGVAGARATAQLPTIGVLGSATPASWSPWLTVFVQRLRELGWIDGRNVAIDVRWGEGRGDRFSEIAAEFVRLKVDVIVTGGNAALAVKQATSTIPIIFAVAADPVGSGLVGSLARPGGNATGLSMGSADVVGKRIELLREVLPGLRRLAIMANAGYSATLLEMNEAQKTARVVGLEPITVAIRQTEDISAAFETRHQ